jgi:hypothetical protein
MKLVEKDSWSVGTEIQELSAGASPLVVLQFGSAYLCFQQKNKTKKIIIEIEKGQKKKHLGTFLNRVSQDINKIYEKKSIENNYRYFCDLVLRRGGASFWYLCAIVTTCTKLKASNVIGEEDFDSAFEWRDVDLLRIYLDSYGKHK